MAEQTAANDTTGSDEPKRVGDEATGNDDMGRWKCNHDPHCLETHTHDSGYFKATYLAKHSMFPNVCSGCKVKFVDKPKKQVKDGEYKVSARSPVWMCVNAGNSRLPCLFAHCLDCHNKEVKKAAEIAALHGGNKRCQDTAALEQEEARKSKRGRKPNLQRGVI